MQLGDKFKFNKSKTLLKSLKNPNERRLPCLNLTCCKEGWAQGA